MRFGRPFDSAMLREDWARSHPAGFPELLRSVHIDLSEQPRLTSDVHSYLLLLHVACTDKGVTPLVMVKVDARTMTNLGILQLDGHFRFED